MLILNPKKHIEVTGNSLFLYQLLVAAVEVYAVEKGDMKMETFELVLKSELEKYLPKRDIPLPTAADALKDNVTDEGKTLA